jgi:hypothetical protein
MDETCRSLSVEFASESLRRYDRTDHVITIIIYKPVFKIAILLASIFLLSSYTFDAAFYEKGLLGPLSCASKFKKVFFKILYLHYICKI